MNSTIIISMAQWLKSFFSEMSQQMNMLIKGPSLQIAMSLPKIYILLVICDLICKNPEQSRIYGYSVSCIFVLYVLQAL